jgi:hypothetical protein
MSQTKFDICSRALVRVKCKPIASFDDGIAESDVAGQEYGPLVEAELAAHRWRFAAKLAALNRLSETPLERWSYYFQLPDDLLMLHAVFAGGAAVPYDRYQDRVACDAAENVVAEYAYRPPENLWPAYFVEAITTRLGAVFARALARDDDLAKRLTDECDKVLLPRARNLDSQQQTTRRLPPSRLVAARRP